MEKQPKPQSQIYIAPEQILNSIKQSEKDSITCIICFGIVINPVQCRSCEKIYCQSQVTDKASFKLCPICKANSWKSGSDVHHLYKQRLSQIELNCIVHEQCKDKIFSYQKFIAHFPQNQELKQISQEYYQFYFDESGQWIQYQSNFNSIINFYMKDSDSFVIGNYLIDTKSMTQTNVNSNFMRKIKKQIEKDRIPKALWTFQFSGDMFQPYSSEACEQLQRGYDDFLKDDSKLVELCIGKFNYSICFKSMRQVNTKTKTSRQIRRILI